MSVNEFKGSLFRITHTVEESGPHNTIPYDYYDDTFTVTIVLKGEGACYIEGTTYPLSDGDAVLISPDEIRSYKFQKSGYHERISLYFSCSVLSGICNSEISLLDIFRARKNIKVSEYNSEKVSFLLNDLKVAVSNSNIHMRESRIHLLILRLLFEFYDACQTSTPHEEHQNRDSVVWKLCNYITGNLTEELSYKNLQKRFSVSEYQLTKVFFRNTGMTVTEYIIQKRLMNAISLIRNGEGIETAAYKSGFKNYSYFYKAFIKHYGISPQRYFLNKVKL